MTAKKLALPKLPARAPEANKGDFGRILIIAGSTSMPGAALLSTLGALRSGAGLVTLATVREVAPWLVGHAPSAMFRGLPATPRGTLSKSALPELLELAGRSDAAAIGPGLSRDPETVSVIRQFVVDTPLPLVIDADGLNAFEGATKLIADRRAMTVLTPHPGEFTRIDDSKRAMPRTPAERIARAEALATRLSSVVLLKGHKTVITDGARTRINTTGNPGMATGGSGDVLTGVIAALLAILPPLEAAALAAHVHGLAGDIGLALIGGRSVLATDIALHLPRAFSTVSQK